MNRKTQRRGIDLYERLLKIMEDDRLFCDVELSRETLARAAMTNRTYMNEALRSKGWTFNSFVNHFRVNAAIDLLLKSDMLDMSVEEIAERCGFRDVDVMNRYVKKSAGLTARALRKRVFDKD